MSDANGPAMSVVILTLDHYGTIRRTMSHLRNQTAANRLEVLIVAASAEQLGLDPGDMEGLHSHQVVEVGVIRTSGNARVAGVRAAKAPVVAFAEDHCYPDAGWAAALIDAHQGPWAAVGPTLGNANPRSMLSWVSLFMGFGPCVELTAAGEYGYTPWHNTSYKRDMLVEFGDRLEILLDAEGFLHHELLARGQRIYLEPKARALHVNTTRLGCWICDLFLGGRVYAGARGRGFSIARRLVYALGSPLIPAIRLPRVLRQVRRVRKAGPSVIRILPALVLGLLIHAAGEMIGYARGTGDALAGFTRTEFHRDRRLSRRDRRDLMST